MTTIKALMVVGLTAVGLAGTAGGAMAQWNPSKIDPFNKNSDVRRLGRDVDRERLKRMESVAGGRFEVTLRNPGKNPVYYSVNGEKQIALLGGMKRTHRGVGTAEVRFDRGLGDGSVFDYTLGSGKTYVFKWETTDYPEVGRVQMLNLFKD